MTVTSNANNNWPTYDFYEIQANIIIKIQILLTNSMKKKLFLNKQHIYFQS